MNFPSKTTVDNLKAKYPKGTKVVAVYFNDPYTDIPKGMKGTVRCIDDAGTIHIVWENGVCLGAVYGEDTIKKAE